MSKVRVCDLCGRIIDIDRNKYRIKGIRDYYSPLLHNRTVRKIDVCYLCMDKIIEASKKAGEVNAND